MKRIFVLAVMMAMVLGFYVHAQAVDVNFTIGGDDYAALTIDSSPICTYDGGGSGSCIGTFDMMPGIWYDITIDYKNRWGSNGLALSWDQPDVDVGVWSGGIVPKLNLRTPDGAGGYISGLHADYYDLSSNFLFDVDGEGPIAAGNADGVNTLYENQIGLWAGTYTFWGTFQEELTGQISINATVVPEPISSTLFLIGGATLGFRRFRKKITN